MGLSPWVVVAVLLAVAALLLAGAALVGVYAAGRRARPAAAADLDGVPADVLGLRQEVAALRAEQLQSLRHLSVVRYDAYDDLGGHLSWSVALADSHGDGLVLTSIHGRSEARTYAKPIRGWASPVPLSPEEERAVADARG